MQRYYKKLTNSKNIKKIYAKIIKKEKQIVKTPKKNRILTLFAKKRTDW